MSRSITAGQASAIAAAHVAACHLVEIDHPSGMLRFTDAPHDLTVGGNAYLGVGRMGAVESIRESAAPEATGIRLTLAGSVASLLAIALNDHVQGVGCRVYVCFFDTATLQPIDSPVLEWSGLTDTLSVSDAPQAGGGVEASITLTAESRFAAFARPRVRRHSHQDQLAAYPGDLFYEFAATMVDRPLVWPSKKLLESRG